MFGEGVQDSQQTQGNKEIDKKTRESKAEKEKGVIEDIESKQSEQKKRQKRAKTWH